MKIRQHIINGISGWLAGLIITLGFSFLWQKIIPVIDRTGQGPGVLIVLSIILLIVSPFAIAGGVIGGRLPREGGRLQQFIYSVIFGAFFVLPFACFLFWYTAW